MITTVLKNLDIPAPLREWASKYTPSLKTVAKVAAGTALTGLVGYTLYTRSADITASAAPVMESLWSKIANLWQQFAILTSVQWPPQSFAETVANLREQSPATFIAAKKGFTAPVAHVAQAISPAPIAIAPLTAATENYTWENVKPLSTPAVKMNGSITPGEKAISALAFTAAVLVPIFNTVCHYKRR